MIGLGFLAVGLLWLALSWYLATRLPAWFGVVKPVWRWILGTALFLVLLVGPFVDHIVGMRQFEKLCKEQTRVQIYPNSINAKSIEFVSGKYQDLSNNAVRIQEAQNQLVDRDSNEVVARYNHFSTKGGWLGPLIRLGSDYGCSAEYSYHPESQKLAPLRKMITSYK